MKSMAFHNTYLLQSKSICDREKDDKSEDAPANITLVAVYEARAQKRDGTMKYFRLHINQVLQNLYVLI